MTFRLHAHSNGTHTLIDEENGQAMHSRIGPELEANLVYADAARIETDLSDSTRVRTLYDIGMGTGANVVAVLARIRAEPSARGKLRVESFESKPDGLRAALLNLSAFPTLREWEAPLRELREKFVANFQIGRVDIEWRLRIGDFYSEMKSAPKPDYLFFDFYSPKIVPELWSFEKFTQLRTHIGDQRARLFTYSAATPVRLNLLAAGFFVGAGTSTGVKTETTIAAVRREDLAQPLSRNWLSKLTSSASIAGPEFSAAKAKVLTHSQWT